MDSVLVLGAGLVARPLTQYLLDRGYRVTVASRTVAKAEQLVGDHANGVTIPLMMDDRDSVQRLVADADLTISLVPPPFHPEVARICLDHGKNLVTTSYISEAMSAFDTEARERGLLLLNEIGLDPGIDHMSAMQTIHEIEAEGGRIDSFVSNCGALPAPDSVDNPWGYKFSWSPIGVVRAVRNDARYLKDGKVVEVPSDQLFDGCWTDEVEGVGTLEVYPNRDSLGYIEMYGIQGVRRMFRGTLRYPGHCAAWSKIADLKLHDEEREFDLRDKTLREAFALAVDLPPADLELALADRLGADTDDPFFDRMAYIGLFSDGESGMDRGSPCDLLVQQLERRLTYAEGQRDMVALQDTLEAVFEGGRRVRRVSTLVDYGIPGGDSATSRTVSLPAAIAADLILTGEIDAIGVHGPTIPGIYKPVLRGLSEMGIVLKESAEDIAPQP